MTASAILTTRNATLTDMVALLRTQRARRLDVVAPAAAVHANQGNLVISGTVQQMTADGITSAAAPTGPRRSPTRGSPRSSASTSPTCAVCASTAPTCGTPT